MTKKLFVLWIAVGIVWGHLGWLLANKPNAQPTKKEVPLKRVAYFAGFQ